jgi:hypothetical protein
MAKIEVFYIDPDEGDELLFDEFDSVEAAKKEIENGEWSDKTKFVFYEKKVVARGERKVNWSWKKV